jgi:N-acetylmuramoyl-L-alanine amidase
MEGSILTRTKSLCRSSILVIVFIIAIGVIGMIPGQAQAAGTTEYTGIVNFQQGDTGISKNMGWVSAPNAFLWDHAKTVTGDFNGDGKGDAAALYNYGNGTTSLFMFISDGQTYTPKLAWQSSPGGFAWERSKLVSGDFNHDGKDDIAIFYDYGNGTSGIWTFTSYGETFSPSLTWLSKAGCFSWTNSKLVAGDINKDGYSDLAVLYNYGSGTSGIWGFMSNGKVHTPYLLWQSSPGVFAWDRSNLTGADYTGDGLSDIGVVYDYGNSQTGIWVFTSHGTAVTPHLGWLSSPGSFSAKDIQIGSGDFDGNGKADVSVLYKYAENQIGIWSFRSDGSSLNPRFEWISNPGEFFWSRTKFDTNDFNGNGQDEFLLVHNYIAVPTVQKIDVAKVGNDDVITIQTTGDITVAHDMNFTSKVINVVTNVTVDNSGVINIPAGMNYIGSINKTAGLGLQIKLNSGAFYKVLQTSNSVQITIKSPDIKDKVIVLDPGHGGRDPGAIGPGKTRESDVNLQVAIKLRDILTGLNAKVIMTRNTDVSLTPGAVDAGELQARINVGYTNNADVFLSIHHDSYSTTSKGTSTYISSQNGNGSPVQSTLLGNLVQENLVSSLGTLDRGVYDSRLYVTRNNQLAAALTEIAFISNPNEEQLIKSDAFQTAAAQGISQGFQQFFNSFK